VTVALWIFSAAYFWTPFLPWASVYALFFQLLGTYFLILYEERANNVFLLWAGVATAATFFTRQPGGVFMLAAIYAYIICTWITKNLSLKKFLRSLYLYTSGVVLVTACFLIWIAGNGAFRDFWLQSIQFAYNFGTNRSDANIPGVLAALFPGGRWPISLWALFPAVTILLSIVYFIRLALKRNIQQTKTMLIIAAIGLSAWLQYYPVTDERHVYWGGTQMFGLLTFALFVMSGYLLHFIPKIGKKLTVVASLALLAYCFAPYIARNVKGGITKLHQPYVTISNPIILRGLLLTPTDAQYYSYLANGMDQYFQNNPNGNVLNLSRDGLYAALNPHIKNIGPLFVNWWELYGLYPNFQNRVGAYIQTNKPMIISQSGTIMPPGYCLFVVPPSANTIENVVRLSLPCD
jgi:hypothetical protein